MDDGGLLGLAGLTLHVADAAAATACWTHVLGLGDPEETGQGAVFRLADQLIELRQAPDGPAGVGVREIRVAVADEHAVGVALAGRGVRARPGPDGIAIAADQLNGVEVVLTEAVPPVARPVAGYRGISHVVVAVREESEALPRWRHVLGVPAGGGERPDRPAHHVPVGPAWFGLTAAGTDAGAVGRFLDRRGEGVYAIGLYVDDVARRRRALVAGGARLVESPASGQVFIHPSSTHGLLIDLLPAPPG